MTEKLTPWYDPKVDGQPVRVGMWQRKLPSGNLYESFWDGALWWIGGGNGERMLSVYQDIPWRGLTEPNEEKQ